MDCHRLIHKGNIPQRKRIMLGKVKIVIQVGLTTTATVIAIMATIDHP